MSSSSSSDMNHLTSLALLAILRRRQKNYSCDKCNPPRSRNNGNSSSSESDVTIYECDCTDESSGSTEDFEPKGRVTTQNNNNIPVQGGKSRPTTKPSTRLQPPEVHAGVVNGQGFMKPSTYVPRPQQPMMHRGAVNIQGSMMSSKYVPRLQTPLNRGVFNGQGSMRPSTFVPRLQPPMLPRGMVNGQGLMRPSFFSPRYQPPMLQGDEAFIRDMKAIEYWVVTQRPPCTYGLKPVAYTKVQNTEKPSAPAAKLPTSGPSTKEGRPCADKKITKTNLSFLEDDNDSSKYFEKSFESSGQPRVKIELTNAINGAVEEKMSASLSKPMQYNLNNEISENQSQSLNPKELSTGKYLESHQVKQLHNVSVTNSKENVANRSLKSKEIYSKNKFPSNVEIVGKIRNHTYQLRNTQKERLEQSSDSSVLTAPYIRSTQNDTSKFNCRKLSRQRAIRDKSKLLHSSAADKALSSNKLYDQTLDAVNKGKKSKSVNENSKFFSNSPCSKEIKPKLVTDTKKVLKRANSVWYNSFVDSTTIHSSVKRSHSLKRKCEMDEKVNESLTKKSKRSSRINSIEIEHVIKDETCTTSLHDTTEVSKSRRRLSNLLFDAEEDSCVEQKKYFL